MFWRCLLVVPLLTACSSGAPIKPSASPDAAPSLPEATATSLPVEGAQPGGNSPTGVVLAFWKAYTEKDIPTLESLMGETLKSQAGLAGSPVKMITYTYPDSAVKAMVTIEATVTEQHPNSAVVDLHTTYNDWIRPDGHHVVEVRHPVTVGLYEGVWKITDWNTPQKFVEIEPPTRMPPTQTPQGQYWNCVKFPDPRLLTIDGMAMVSADVTEPVQVWLSYGAQGGQVGELAPGAAFVVKSDPTCVTDRGYWYQIHADTTLPDGNLAPAIEGWVRETDDAGNYVLIPCEEGTDCGIIGEGM